jgi:hypothetical protein
VKIGEMFMSAKHFLPNRISFVSDLIAPSDLLASFSNLRDSYRTEGKKRGENGKTTRTNDDDDEKFETEERALIAILMNSSSFIEVIAMLPDAPHSRGLAGRMLSDSHQRSYS